MNLNKIFTSHMVFAANKPIRIYGEGAGRCRINFAGIIKEAVSYGDKWYIEFPEMKYGGPYILTAEFEDETVVLDDIYIGEVYLFCGQSNIEFRMEETNLEPESFGSNNMLRMFCADRFINYGFFEAKHGWTVCRKEQIKYWSAVAFLTSEKIVKEKNVAVGVIVCCQGASVIESWVPEGAFANIGINIPDEKKHIDHTYKEYEQWNSDGALYRHTLSQVIPFSISAVIWYQGESDTSQDEGEVYQNELRELIKIWRSDFRNMSLPFVIVQIADYICRPDEAWKLVQKAQYDVQYSVENVKTVVSADVCENNDIHPKTKDKLAARIANELMKMSCFE